MDTTFLIVCLILVISTVQGAPAAETPPEQTTTPMGLLLPSGYDDSLLHPHVVTIARLESLLKRAGEIFRPAIYPVMEHIKEKQNTEEENLPAPHEQMQPPAEQPYNFYLPLYDIDSESPSKLHKMEKIAPPLKSSKASVNFAAVKPKKSPKKFDSSQKHINMKWLNSYEKETGDVPKAAYLENDEKNRINFDDSFFAVDMLVKSPDNNPHKEPKAQESNQDDFQSEEGEDLMAAAGAQLTQVMVT